MHAEDSAYEADGLEMLGHLAVDDQRDGTRPAVLVCHEGPGLDEHAKGVAERLAGLGYVAFALDYNGGGQPMAREEVFGRLGPLMGDPDRIRALGRAGLDILLAQPQADRSKVASIGYCFGGTMSLELARGGTDLSAVVGFHSGLATSRPEDAANITATVLVCIGTEDPLIPADQRSAFEQEMRDGNVADWRMTLYGGAGHSFTNPKASEFGMPGIAYEERADARSWREMLDLFDELWGPPAA